MLTEFLKLHGQELVQKSADMFLIDRIFETDRMIEILSKKKKNSIIIHGEYGVGKTYLVNVLAKRIHQNSIPNNFHWNQIYSLDINKILSGTQYRGQLEEKVQKLVQDLQAEKATLLLIDECQAAFNTSNTGLMSLLKPYISDGSITCICLINTDDFQKTFSKDKTLMKRFHKMLLQPMSEELVKKVLNIATKELEKHHNVVFSDEVIDYAIQVSKKYLLEKKLPDSAIDLLDETASMVASKKRNSDPQYITIIKDNLEDLERTARIYIKQEKYELLIDLKKDIQKEWSLLRQERKKISIQQALRIYIEDIRNILRRSFNFKDDNDGPLERIQALNLNLNFKIIGQDNIIKNIVKVIKRNILIPNINRPIASFLFVGPSGVGKTETAKIIADNMFTFGQSSILRLDMSEYSERFTISKLIGSPNGYVNSNEGGILTEFVALNPNSLILLDEVEKAHPDIFNLFLQILDNAKLADARGFIVNFSNSIIIMTSNLGNNAPESIGFQEHVESINNMKEINKFFKVEFLNRLDNIVFFKVLNVEDFKKIYYIELESILHRLTELGINLNISVEVHHKIITLGCSKKHGVRFLRMTILENIVDPALNLINDEFLHNKDKLTLHFSLSPTESILIK